MPAMPDVQDRPGPAGENRVAVELARHRTHEVKAPLLFSRIENSYIGGKLVCNRFGEIFRRYGRIGLEKTDLPQRANSGISSAGSMNVRSFAEKIRHGLDKLTLNGSLARLDLPAGIVETVVGDFQSYVPKGHVIQKPGVRIQNSE